MPRIAISAKGESVDFDLLAIKQQLSQSTPSIQVANRQNYIDEKFGRSLDARPAPVEPSATNTASWNVLENPEVMDPVLSDEDIRAQFMKEKSK